MGAASRRSDGTVKPQVQLKLVHKTLFGGRGWLKFRYECEEEGLHIRGPERSGSGTTHFSSPGRTSLSGELEAFAEILSCGDPGIFDLSQPRRAPQPHQSDQQSA